jgi:hypothetical protein
MKKVSVFYRIKAFALAGIILFSSCGTNLPTKPTTSSGEVSTGQPAKPEVTSVPDEARPSNWFWNPSWWEQNGALVPEVVGTINENPWILQTAGRARSAALRSVNAQPQFNLAAARQKWNATTGTLTVIIPFQDVVSPYFVSVFIHPQWNAWGPHTWNISSVGLSGALKVAGDSSKIAVMTVLIKSNATFGTGFMRVFNTTTRTLVSSFETESNALETQIAALASPVTNVTTAGVAVQPCAPSNVTVSAYKPNTPPAPTPVPPCSNSTVNPPTNTGSNTIDTNNTISGTKPLPAPTVDAAKPNCPALAQTLSDARRNEAAQKKQWEGALAAVVLACSVAGAEALLNPLADAACLVAAWAAQGVQDSFVLAQEQTKRAAADYQAAKCGQ